MSARALELGGQKIKTAPFKVEGSTTEKVTVHSEIRAQERQLQAPQSWETLNGRGNTAELEKTRKRKENPEKLQRR